MCAMPIVKVEFKWEMIHAHTDRPLFCCCSIQLIDPRTIWWLLPLSERKNVERHKMHDKIRQSNKQMRSRYVCIMIMLRYSAHGSPCNQQHSTHIEASITIKLIAQNWVAKGNEIEIVGNEGKKHINKKGLRWDNLRHLTYNVHTFFSLVLNIPSFITQVSYFSCCYCYCCSCWFGYSICFISLSRAMYHSHWSMNFPIIHIVYAICVILWTASLPLCYFGCKCISFRQFFKLNRNTNIWNIWSRERGRDR